MAARSEKPLAQPLCPSQCRKISLKAAFGKALGTLGATLAVSFPAELLPGVFPQSEARYTAAEEIRDESRKA